MLPVTPANLPLLAINPYKHSVANDQVNNHPAGGFYEEIAGIHCDGLDGLFTAHAGIPTNHHAKNKVPQTLQFAPFIKSARRD